MWLVLLGIVLAGLHYFSEGIHIAHGKHKVKALSLAAGIFMAYLFLDLFPRLYSPSASVNRIAMVFVLVGFAVFHVAEKRIYKSRLGKERKRRELKEVHSLGFFAYHFIIGIVFASLSGSGFLAAALFFIPLALHTAISSASLKEIHGTVRESLPARLLLSASTLLGIIFGLYYSIQALLEAILLGFVVGALLYIMLIDSVPKERQGRPEYFIAGAALYALLIAASWVL